MAVHSMWIVESGIEPKNRSVYEHKVLCRAMQLGYANDGLNICNLRSFEYLNCRRQLIEEAHKSDPKKPDFEGSQYYMGEPEDASGVAISSTLRAHVAQEFARQSAIDKERRKAREAKGHR